MGLRDRIVNERARSAQSALDGSEVYRRRLLEEVDLDEIAELSEEPAPRAPGARRRPHGLRARAR